MVLPLRSPGPVDYNGYDIYVYPRQSSENSAGNANTASQEQDLPKRVADYLHVDPETHPFFYVAELEVESGTDGSIRLKETANGIELDNFLRVELKRMLFMIQRRWAATRRPSILAIGEPKRLGRSSVVLPVLEALANETHRNFFIWDGQSRRLLDPTNPNDNKILNVELTFSGKGESEGKSTSVLNARASIIDRMPHRSLGEQYFGYDKIFTDNAGRPIEDPIVYQLTTRKRAGRAFVVNPEQAEIVRRIFALCDEGQGKVTAADIARVIQREFGNNPERGREWTVAMVRRILGNSIYKGYRTAGHRKIVNVGAKQVRRAAPHEILRSPFDPSLAIVEEAVFDRVQQILQDWQMARGNKGGRPLNIDALFHRTKLLRCALCGHALVIVRAGEGHYTYTCQSGRKHGQPRHQTHGVVEIDALVTRDVANLFAGAQPLLIELRAQVQQGRGKAKLRDVKADLEQARTDLADIEDGYLFAVAKHKRGEMTAERLASLEARMNAQATKVAELEQQLTTVGTDFVTKAKERRLEQLEGLAAYATLPFDRRRLLLSDLFKAIWIWPDGRFVPQWKAESEPDVVARTGRPLRVAVDWPLLDMHRLYMDTVRLVKEGEVPMIVLRDMGTSPAVRNALVASVRTGKTPDRLPRGLAMFRTFMIVREEYLNLPKLRSDLVRWAEEGLAGGKTIHGLMTESGASLDAMQTLLSSGSSRRATLVRMAKRLGWDLASYRALPEGIYDHEALAEMYAWLTITTHSRLVVASAEPDAGAPLCAVSGTRPPSVRAVDFARYVLGLDVAA